MRLILLTIAFLSSAAFAATWCVRRVRAHREARQGVLELARAQLGWPTPVRSGFPTPTVDGYHCGYPITLECVPQGHEVSWRVHSELTHDWAGHVLIHGDERPSKMRELYGMEVMLSGDPEFDRVVVIATNAEQTLRPLLANRYLRDRFQQLGGLHVQIEIDRRHVYAELLTVRNPQGSTLPAVLDLMTTLCGMLDLALTCGGPTTATTHASSSHIIA